MSRGWGEFFGEFAGDWGAGAGSRRVGAGGGPQARRCEASPTAGGARRAARRAAACGRSLRVLRILGGNGGVLGEFVQVLGGLVRGEGRRPGDAEHRRRRAEPAGAARRAAACGRILRFLQILMWGQSSSTGTVLPSVRMTLTRLGRQMACSPSLASQPFLMHTWSGQSLVIKAMR